MDLSEFLVREFTISPTLFWAEGKKPQCELHTCCHSCHNILQFASVALRLNGQTLVSAMSESGGHNPVTQSAIALLKAGDVVQLEVEFI